MRGTPMPNDQHLPRKSKRVAEREHALMTLANQARERGSLGFSARQITGGIEVVDYISLSERKFTRLSLAGEVQNEFTKEILQLHKKLPNKLNGTKIAVCQISNPWY